MARVSDLFPSTFLKAQDLNGNEVSAVMAGVAVEEIKGPRGSEHKPVLSFYRRGTQEMSDRKLVLNKTNANTISALYGEETDGWTGKSITMFPTMVDFQGRQTLAIRIRSNAVAAPPAADPLEAPPAQEQVPAEAYDDDIPF